MQRDLTWPPKVLRWSELKQVAKSPAHFRAAYLEPEESSPSHLLGAYVHELVLGGDTFVVYDGERRGNAWKDFKAAHEGREIVTSKEVERAKPIAEAVLRSKVAAPFLKGLREKELEWTGLMGCRFAGRLDVITATGVVDLKTTWDADPQAFARIALRMSYHAQLAHYLMGAKACGHRAETAHIIAVETSRPYPVTVVELPNRMILEGEKLVRAWVERVQACQLADEWPGYTQSVTTLDVPDDEGTDLVIDGDVVAA